METPQIENSTLEKKEIRGLGKYLRRFKAAVLPLPAGKRKVNNKKKSISTVSNPNIHKSTNLENSTMVEDQSTVKVVTVEGNPSADKNIIVNGQEKSSVINGPPVLEPMKAFLLLNSHDTIIPLNTDSFTCPQCHTPHSVHYVHEDTEEGKSKEIYICLSHGNHGCGWEGAEKPNEDDIHAHITATVGFKPLRLN